MSTSNPRPTEAPRDELLTVHAVAALLKLNQQTIRNWIAHGELPHLRVGRRVRILRRDLNALLEGSTVKPSQANPPPPQNTTEKFWDGEPHAGPVMPSQRG